jgi:hypothetical protein
MFELRLDRSEEDPKRAAAWLLASYAAVRTEIASLRADLGAGVGGGEPVSGGDPVATPLSRRREAARGAAVMDGDGDGSGGGSPLPRGPMGGGHAPVGAVLTTPAGAERVPPAPRSGLRGPATAVVGGGTIDREAVAAVLQRQAEAESKRQARLAQMRAKAEADEVGRPRRSARRL